MTTATMDAASKYSPNFEFSKGVHELDNGFNKQLDDSIYADLPKMPVSDTGPNGEKLFQLLERSYPEGTLYPHAMENRRKLYMSIYFLRTASKRRWANDVQVQKGDYVEDKLFKNTKVLH